MCDRTSVNLDALAAAFRADAGLIPLQRRVRRLIADLYAILEAGVTVRALADALAARGVTDRSGQPLSYGHLRVLLARASRGRRLAPERRPIPRLTAQPLAPTAASSDRPVGAAPDFSRGLFGSDLDPAGD